MKIAGLIPFRYNPDHPVWWPRRAVNHLLQVCDRVIVLQDRSPVAISLPDSVEDVRVMGHFDGWNDYGNRMTLLARAMHHKCDVILWMDSDDSFYGTVTREEIVNQAREMKQGGFESAYFQVYEMWTHTHYREDGYWGQRGRIGMQFNPLLKEYTHWAGNGPLHVFPHQIGPIMHGTTKIVHWAMSTPELRQKRVERYKKLDPENKWQPRGYDYLLDETGLELVPAYV